MATTFSYACKDYPGMEDCPFSVTTETEAEVWKQMELHAADAHGEAPSEWSDEDRRFGNVRNDLRRRRRHRGVEGRKTSGAKKPLPAPFPGLLGF